MENEETEGEKAQEGNGKMREMKERSVNRKLSVRKRPR
jgi:hypothetical protein